MKPTPKSSSTNKLKKRPGASFMKIKSRTKKKPTDSTGEKKVSFYTTPQVMVIPSRPPTTAPPPLPTVPHITLPATGPARAQDDGGDGGDQDLLQGAPKHLVTGTGKKKRSRPGATTIQTFSPDDVVDVADLEENTEVVALGHQGIDPTRVQLVRSALLALNMTQLTQGELIKTIKDAIAIFEQIKDLPDNAVRQLPLGIAEVALAMRTRTRLEDTLRSLVRIDQPHVLPLHQIQELTTFLDRNRGLAKYLSDNGIGFLFGSDKARGQGGGVFKNGNIHTLGKEDLPARQWLQLVIHEAGHATYQRLLLGQPTPPNYLDTGTLGELRAEITRLRAAADTEGIPLEDAGSSFNGRYLAIQQDFAANGADALWKKTSKDAQDLYTAWIVLRQNGGKDMQGIDMGPKMSPPERLDYQAKNFIEFIAESFMHVATGEIKAHWEHISTDASVSPEAKAAWQTAMGILDKHVRQAVLGWDTMW